MISNIIAKFWGPGKARGKPACGWRQIVRLYLALNNCEARHKSLAIRLRTQSALRPTISGHDSQSSALCHPR